MRGRVRASGACASIGFWLRCRASNRHLLAESGIVGKKKAPHRTGEHLLHGVFGVFRMATDLHAERVRPFSEVIRWPPQQLPGIVLVEEGGGSDQFRSHCLGESAARPVYSQVRMNEESLRLKPADSLRARERRGIPFQGRLNHLAGKLEIPY